MKSLHVTVQMKATEQHNSLPMVLFIILYNTFQTFEPVDETPVFDHSNGSSSPTFACTVIICMVEMLQIIHTSSHLELFVNDCQIPNSSSNHNLE